MKQVVIVAHGSPSDPDPQDRRLHQLAQQVGALCDAQVRGATLAKPGSLEGALEGFDAPIIYPFFMAEGWFTKRELPRRLAAVNVVARHMDPFGVDPALPDLIAAACEAAAKDAGLDPCHSDLILCAHGSKIARKSKNSAYDMAQTLRGRVPFWRIRVALIEEAPFLEDVAATCTTGLCLPFFALRAGHVEGDIPEALQNASFSGPAMAPIGEHPQVPNLISNAINLF
ncbi:hypothetical protein BFP70_15005 [Thioclava sp. SK-1]|uniref:CbiX/SirB N-terminal domain-containing protein n=1 Tax=Thioclava sp. SK-1 TaxID=1889770 RepID=UPI000823FA6E|nr:CbiX/SirB N-terminal domain-containing protein [Thioclava sp. SK-1]OCX61691.1 hypothetical protein BFP70_15005 [Thioclava sp. SK-1]